MKVKQILKMTGSVALSAVLAATTTMPVTVFAEDNNNSSKSSTETSSSSKGTEKTETVYSVLNGDGSVSDIVVSSWLHNDGGIKNLKEKLNLTDVKNVKTDETPEDSNGVYTWNSDSNDLYYQGNATDKLPVSVKITYELDGQEMSESDLAGKSGHLTIKIHMTNENSETKEINGKNVIIHPLFVAGGLVTLDNDHVSNVSCDQGKIVSDGSSQMLVFAAVPGLKETLDSADLSKVSDELSVGDDVTIDCDVTDYESLSMMMGMSNEMDMDEVLDEAGSIDELTSGMNDLMSADDQLLDGSKQLEEGTQQLITQSEPLTSSSDSIRVLSNGALTLNDGATRLQAALGQYTGGVSQLNAGVDALYAIPQGAAQISSAITTSTDEEHPSLLAGIASLQAGITKFKNTIDGTMTSTDISAMMQSMGTANTILESMSTTLTNDLKVVKGLKDTLDKKLSSIGDLTSTTNTIKSSASQINDAMTASIVALTQAEASLPDGDAKTAVANSLETLKTQAGTLTIAFNTLDTTFSSLSGLSDTLNGAISQLTQLQSDVTTAQTALGQLSGIVSSSKGSVEKLLGMQSSIDATCDKFIAGTTALTDGVTKLNAGVQDLEQKSQAGIDQVKAATSTLSSNNAALNEGMASLQSGTQTIANQSGSFNEMADGLDTLKSAFETLHDGAKQLADGQQQFKDEGLSQLKEKVDLGVDELDMLQDIIDEVKAMNKKYREYAGDNEDMDVTTRYVFRTKTSDSSDSDK